MGNSTTLKVVKRVNETADAVSLYFKQPFFSKIKYQSGQFLTLIFTINGEEYRRAYSLNSAPGIDKELSVTIKKVNGGVVSNHVFDTVKAGDTIEVIKPRGTFSLLPKAVTQRHVVLFGGGSGITPLISIAKSVLNKEPKSFVTLVYCNQNEDSMIFRSAITEMERSHVGKFRAVHILEKPLRHWNGLTGRITSDRIPELLKSISKVISIKSEYYICGPGGMMDAVKAGLELNEVPEEQIFMESFTGSPEGIKPESQNLNFEARTMKLIINKQEYGLHVPANTTILDAALQNKLKIPFSCCSGSCATCMCKVKYGEVKMVGKNCLTEKDISKGYVLACMSYPVSEELVLQVE